LFFLNGALSLIVLFPIFSILLRNEKTYPQVFRLKRFWSKLLIYNVGLRYEIISGKNNLLPQPCIICPNHGSYLDIIMTYRVISHYFHFMGKAELKKVPLFNRFFDNMNITVDRGSIVASHKAFMRASGDLDKGISIAVFPEATIPECTPEMGRLKNGAFKLAIDKQVPIVPVVFLDNWKALPDSPRKHRFPGMPGKLRVVILDPISTKGMGEGDLQRLKSEYSEVMNKTLVDYEVLNESRKSEFLVA